MAALSHAQLSQVRFGEEDGDQGAAAGRQGALAEMRRVIEHAERVVRHAPDEAALLIDGLFARMVALALRPSAASAREDNVLALLDMYSPAFAGQLHLALHASNVEAKIVHARRCLSALACEPSTISPRDSGEA